MALTPKQFNLLATKEDLKRMATKEDLKRMATKEDLKKTDDKVDKLGNRVDKLDKRVDKLDNKLDKLVVSVIKNTEDIKDIREKMATKEDVNKILTAVDDIAKKFDDHNIEHVANQAAHDRFEERITQIEKSYLKST